MNGEDRAAQPAESLPATGNAAAAVDADAEHSCRRREGCEALARAISCTLGDVMREFDSRAEGASRSQDDLCSAIDRLTGVLDKLLEDAPLPFMMQNAAKISSIRRRVYSLNLVLKTIQRRLDNIDRMLSVGLPDIFSE